MERITLLISNNHFNYLIDSVGFLNLEVIDYKYDKKYFLNEITLKHKNGHNIDVQMIYSLGEITEHKYLQDTIINEYKKPYQV
jgi:hypothetical protein